MGAVFAAPLGAIGSCLGSCAGTFLAAGCCRLAFSGEAFILASSLISACTAESWMPWVCDKIAHVTDDFGICQCRDPTETDCWYHQSLYRAQAGGTIIYLLLLLLYLSGCKDGASRSYSVGKFMAVLVLWLIGLFLPNKVYSTYGSAATVASALFLLMQSVLLIDFAYTWNEAWHTKAEEARRRDVFGNGYRNWLIGIVVIALLMLIVAGVISGFLISTYTSGQWMVPLAMALCLVCLVVSITEWCEHGNMLASCVMILYISWLLSDTFAVDPGASTALFPSWVGLLVCGVSLTALMAGLNIDSSSQALTAPPAGESAAAEEGRSGENQEPETGASADRWGFALHCIIHLAATLYISAALAPVRGMAPYVAHIFAVFSVIVLYGWTLVAPKVLSNRQF